MALITSRFCDICQSRKPPVVNCRFEVKGGLISIGPAIDQETAHLDLCGDCLLDLRKHIRIRPGVP